MSFLKLPELATNADYEPQWGRNQKPSGPIRDGLASASAKRDKWEIFHGLLERRCIAGVVQNAEELLESEHLNARGFVVKTQIDGQEVRTAGAPA